MSFVGVDGCKAGWFWVRLTRSGDWDAHIAQRFDQVWGEWRQAELILVDIPIGLRGSGDQERLCDREARRILGRPRSSSVFPPPCRAALSAHTYREATRINERHTGRRLNKQTWNITPKIREVDNLIQSEHRARSVIRESHPEVLFFALNEGRGMMHNKRAEDGFSERLRLLERVYPGSNAVVTSALGRFARKDVGRDDILDALVAAVAAMVGEHRLRMLPERPERDSTGLPMEIVYYPMTADTRQNGCGVSKSDQGRVEHGKAGCSLSPHP